MTSRFTNSVVAAVLGLAILAPAFGYNADVRERMMVRNIAFGLPDDSTRPVVAVDFQPGAGIFNYCEGPVGFGWPLVSAGQHGLPYNVTMLDTTGQLLYRSRIPVWGTWDSVTGVAEPGFEPMFETQNIASSPVSQKVCITWVRTDTSPMPGFYRISTDGGASWGSTQELVRPAAYGGDTVTSFHVSALYPFFDADDQLHVLAAVHPVVHDTGFIIPAGIWHWCPDLSPNWTLIHRAGCAPEHLRAPVGYNALYADRPSGWYYPDGALIVTWEEFDSANVETETNLLRADIHAYLMLGSSPWDSCVVSSPGTNSNRFPFMIQAQDTTYVLFEQDQIAGFSPLGQGPSSDNAIVVQVVCWDGQWPQPDTIAGTTYDLQSLGPVRRTLCYVPGRGVHALSLWSVSTSGRTFPDLNTRYNYYDLAYHCWNWIDPDYMQSGINVFPQRTAFGSLDVNQDSGVAVISGCYPPPLPPVAVEETPKARVRTSNATTVVRGVLFLPRGSDFPVAMNRGLEASLTLLDATGRRVMVLRPGANDVRSLAPGVYFVREERAGSREQPAASVRKVVVTR
jgi:hypothetical protein